MNLRLKGTTFQLNPEFHKLIEHSLRLSPFDTSTQFLSRGKAIRGAPTSTCGSELCRFARTFSSAIPGIFARRRDPYVPSESFPTSKAAAPAPFDPRLQSNHKIISEILF